MFTGASTNDYALRVNRLSSKIRECIFGPDTTTKFDYPGAAARTFHPIFLPTASGKCSITFSELSLCILTTAAVRYHRGGKRQARPARPQ